jgi:hypothetical protein
MDETLCHDIRKPPRVTCSLLRCIRLRDCQVKSLKPTGQNDRTQNMPYDKKFEALPRLREQFSQNVIPLRYLKHNTQTAGSMP